MIHNSTYATQGQSPDEEFKGWCEAVDRAYFHLKLGRPRTITSFHGQLDTWSLPTLSLSRMQSTPLQYQRLAQHCKDTDKQILVTVPVRNRVEFTQLGRHADCDPGQFILEHSDEPYEFKYAHDNQLWVLKVPESALQVRVGNPSRLCAKAFDAYDGAGQLFLDYVRLMAAHSQNQTHDVLALMGVQAIDLLALAINQKSEIAQEHSTVVRAAHMGRVEAYIRAHLLEPDLTPTRIAQACGISVRYLHDLFRDGESVAQSVRTRRLRVAYEQLSSGMVESVAQVAYRIGFGDHAQFSRLFRRAFGLSPSEVLKRKTA